MGAGGSGAGNRTLAATATTLMRRGGALLRCTQQVCQPPHGVGEGGQDPVAGHGLPRVGVVVQVPAGGLQEGAQVAHAGEGPGRQAGRGAQVARPGSGQATSANVRNLSSRVGGPATHILRRDILRERKWEGRARSGIRVGEYRCGQGGGGGSVDEDRAVGAGKSGTGGGRVSMWVVARSDDEGLAVTEYHRGPKQRCVCSVLA